MAEAIQTPPFTTDHYQGKDKSKDSIRLGTVRAELHPDWPKLPATLQSLAQEFGVAEIPLKQAASPETNEAGDETPYQWPGYDNSHARAVTRQVIDANGKPLAEGNGKQVELWYRPGMTYHTLQHEVRHLRQFLHISQPKPHLAGTQYELPLAYSEYWQKNEAGELQLLKIERTAQTPQIIQRDESDVMETHNLLVDLKVRLEAWRPGDNWSEVRKLLDELEVEVILGTGQVLANWQQHQPESLAWFDAYFDDPANPPPGGTWSELLELYQQVREMDETRFKRWKQENQSGGAFRKMWRRIRNVITRK